MTVKEFISTLTIKENVFINIYRRGNAIKLSSDINLGVKKVDLLMTELLEDLRLETTVYLLTKEVEKINVQVSDNNITFNILIKEEKNG